MFRTESVLITSRLNAPLIQIIPDGPPSLPPSEGDANSLEGAGKFQPCTGAAGLSTNPVDLFYTNESNRSIGGCYYPASSAQPSGSVGRQNQDVRNSLPRVSLTSLGRAFTPRSSWNGSKAALLQLQRKSSRAEGGGVPSYLAKKYHLSNANSHKDQVGQRLVLKRHSH